METALQAILDYFCGCLVVENPVTSMLLWQLFHPFSILIISCLEGLCYGLFLPNFLLHQRIGQGSCPIKDLIPQLHFSWAPFLYRSFVLIAACFPSFCEDQLFSGASFHWKDGIDADPP